MKKVFNFVFLFVAANLFFHCKKEHPQASAPSVVVPYQDNSYVLPDSIVDAEYTRVKDLIVAVISVPDSLLIIDPINKTKQSLPLAYPPNCISISPNGNYAAVGHNGWISFFDLNSRTLIATLSTSFNAADIVLSNNKWAYALPGVGSQNIKCVNLATGAMGFNTGNPSYVGLSSKGKLDISGNYLYVTNSSLEKENITGGIATYMYPDNDMNYYAYGNIWMFDDSTRMLFGTSNVLHVTNLQATDMTYAGSIGPVGSTMYGYSGTNYISTADYSKKADKVYVVQDIKLYPGLIPDTTLKKYSGDYLAYQGSVVLPKLNIVNAVPNKPYSARGYFGFFNSAGTKFHLIVNGKDSLGTHSKWAIESFDVN